jgi:hypothetical protein
MPKISLSTADLEMQEKNAVFCRSCSATADEGENYCIHCKSYWADCDAGLWDDPEPIS